MVDPRYCAALAKHLPPSAATLRVLDMDSSVVTNAALEALRGDLEILSARYVDLTVENMMDSIVAINPTLDAPFLAQSLRLLRAGGRLIMVDTSGEPAAEIVKTLEDAGFIRILVEPAVEELSPAGVLMRGEKPHTTADTWQRIALVADQDAQNAALAQFKGRYVHLLIRQTPNKPAWALRPDEAITWDAVALQDGDTPVLLAFSSLPRAVSFMQPAVIGGHIHDVSKVGKFSRETAKTWTHPLMINPPSEILQSSTFCFVPIDPETAEAPDE